MTPTLNHTLAQTSSSINRPLILILKPKFNESYSHTNDKLQMKSDRITYIEDLQPQKHLIIIHKSPHKEL